MKRDLRFEAVYPQPPERVWRALTDRNELAQWLMANDFSPAVGTRFRFRGQPRPGFDGIVQCEVIEMDAPRRLAYKWGAGTIDTVVRFILQADEHGGTRLIVEHTGFDGAGSLMIASSVAWKRMLRESLPAVLNEGRTVVPTSVESNFDIAFNLIDRYERGAGTFIRLMRSVPAEALDTAAEGEWSVRQTAFHIVDAELVGATRLRMVAAQSGSKLAAYAGDIWARELHYSRLPLEPALKLFEVLRRTTTTMLRLLDKSAWSNRAQHEEAGEVTLESLLDSHCEHAEVHLQEIEALLKTSPLSAHSKP